MSQRSRISVQRNGGEQCEGGVQKVAGRVPLSRVTNGQGVQRPLGGVRRVAHGRVGEGENGRLRPSKVSSARVGQRGIVRESSGEQLRERVENRVPRVDIQIQRVEKVNEGAVKFRQETGPVERFHFEPQNVGDPKDPMDVCEYDNEIYRRLREREVEIGLYPLMEGEVTERDVEMIVDSMCRFHYKLQITTNGFYIFVGIMDRYLSTHQVSLNKLKLVGAAALMLGSKMDDIYPAQSADLIQLGERSFNSRELFEMEIEIANGIGFDFAFPTPLYFLTEFLRLSGQSREEVLYARYVLELIQASGLRTRIYGSRMAALGLLAARVGRYDDVWPREIAGFTRYSLDELREEYEEVRRLLVDTKREESSFIRRKYGSELFLRVAHNGDPGPI